MRARSSATFPERLLPLLALLPACVRPRTPAPHFHLELRWNLVPGQVLRYQLRSELERGDERIARVERWVYLVQAREAGGWLLRGHLEDLSAERCWNGRPLPADALRDARLREALRLRLLDVSLELSPDGRLHALGNASWTDMLPHRLLGLVLPAEAVELGQRWEDGGVPALLGGLLRQVPSPGSHGEHRLVGVSWDWLRGNGGPSVDVRRVRALLETRGEAWRGPRPMLELEGTAAWDVAAGRLERRELRVGGGWPGTLHLSLRRLERDQPGAQGEPSSSSQASSSTSSQSCAP